MSRHPGGCNGAGCRLCWLADNDPRYQSAWGLPVTAVPRVQRSAAVQRGHRGGKQHRRGVSLVPCPECKGKVLLKVPLTEPPPIQPPSAGRAELISRNQARPASAQPLTWAVGVTTVPERRTNGLLLGALASLRAAGFRDDGRCSVRLFVDGDHENPDWHRLCLDGGLSGVTFRWPRVRTVGNWLLSATELLVRNPRAERFLMLQDDVVMVRNLRGYLDGIELPERSYFNLYSQRSNDDLIVGKRGWVRGCLNDPGNPTLQKGLGALALMFTREGLTTCLQSFHWGKKLPDVGEDHAGMPQGKGPRRWPDDGSPRLGGQVRVDGTVVTCMNLAGWSEMVHAPSLVQHLGDESSMGVNCQAKARSFPGAGFDALTLLPANS